MQKKISKILKPIQFKNLPRKHIARHKVFFPARKKKIMNNFLIINFNKQMKFEVYKYGGYLYDNINDGIVNKNIFVSVVLGFQKF